MTSIIKKRCSLHRDLHKQREQKELLEKENSHLQGLANIGTATCMIAHEINNLLTPLANYATLALKHPEDKVLADKALERTRQNCERASGIMETILTVAGNKTNQKENTRLISLVQEVFTCLCRDFKKDGITVEIKIPEKLQVWGIGIQIQQVIMNLILNARDAMLANSGGVLKISAGENKDSVRIKISDTGCGIDTAHLERIFEPFFTTKDADDYSAEHSGCGLGLTFCKRIIDEHEGVISVESESGRGSTFEITLPKPPVR